MTTATLTLLGAPGTGSAIVEAMLIKVNIPYVLEQHSFDRLGPGCDYPRLMALNPLGQLPTLVLSDGVVLTETAAIAIYLGDVFGGDMLVPPIAAPERASFLRWIVFLGSAYYSTFTFGDFPKRWVQDEVGAAELVTSTRSHRERLLLFLDSQVCGQPWFLGERFSALDLFIYVIGAWSPRSAWLEKNCPKLTKIRQNLALDPELAPLWQRHFPS